MANLFTCLGGSSQLGHNIIDILFIISLLQTREKVGVFYHRSLKLHYKLDDEFGLVFVVRTMYGQIDGWMLWTQRQINGQTMINIITIIVIYIARLLINDSIYSSAAIR